MWPLDIWKICRPLLLALSILCRVHRPVPSHVAGSYCGVVFGILIVLLNKPQIEARNVVIDSIHASFSRHVLIFDQEFSSGQVL
jgi:hypothetical protein